MNTLFPVSPTLVSSGFTTSPSLASSIPQISLVPLTDAALGVHKVTSHTTHSIVTPPPSAFPDSVQAPTEAWEAFYPAGSINPGNKEAPRGGFGFYLRGPKAFQDALKDGLPEEVMMSYAVMFEEGWAWQKGGKLPRVCAFQMLLYAMTC